MSTPTPLSPPRTRPETPRAVDPPTRSSAALTNTTTLAALIAAALTIAVMLIALATRAALAAQARSWLHYTFVGVPARPQTAVGIFANNTRELMAVFGLLLIAQLAVRRDGRPTRAQLLLRTGGELILSGAIVANMLVVGAAIGGYGTRMVRAMLPHGPVEMAAYALALALYVQGRSRPLPSTRLAGTIAGSIALLAVAALLETFA